MVAFINRDGALDEFYEHLDPLLDYLLPQYLAEGKSHLVIAVGCTGGRHRSVAIAEHLAERYRSRRRLPRRRRSPRRGGGRVIDHIGFEVADLDRTTAFYDPVFFALGGRRMVDSERAVAYGINAPGGVVHVRGLGPGHGYGHLALRASGKVAVDAAHAAGLANGGADDGPPGLRPRYGGRTTPPT